MFLTKQSDESCNRACIPVPMIATVVEFSLDRYFEAIDPAIAVLMSVKYPLSSKTAFNKPVFESNNIINPLLVGRPIEGLLKKPEATLIAKLSKPLI